VADPRRALRAAAFLFAFCLPLGVAPAEIALAAGLLLVAAERVRRRRPPGSPIDLPLAVLLGAALLSALASDAPAYGLRAAASFWTLGAFYLGREVATDRRTLGRVWGCLAAGAVLAVAAAALQVASGGPGVPASLAGLHLPLRSLHQGRATGFFSHPMTFAGQQSMLLVAVAALAFSPAVPWRAALLRGLLLVPLGAGLVLAATRGAFVAAATGLAALAAFARGVRRRSVAAAAAGALLLLGLGLGTLLASRMAGLQAPAPWQGREAMWQAALEMLRAHPLFGVGPSGFRRLARTLLDTSRYRPAHAHSTPLELLADLGMVGGGAFFALWAAYFGALRRRRRAAGAAGRSDPRRPFENASIAAVLVFLGVGLLEFNLGDAEVAMLALFVAGLPMGAAFDAPDGRP
jgi:O-antigen ligase